MTRTEPASPDIARLARGIRSAERAVIARAITLVESRRADHQRAARRLVQDLLPDTGGAVRVGITGTPGVGKSTTIDALGSFLTEQGRKVLRELMVRLDRRGIRVTLAHRVRKVRAAD